MLVFSLLSGNWKSQYLDNAIVLDIQYRWCHLLFSISQFNSRNPNPKPNSKPNHASLRARIGNYATQHGTAAATRHFEQELKRKLPESTIRKCKTEKSVTAKMQYW